MPQASARLGTRLTAVVAHLVVVYAASDDAKEDVRRLHERDDEERVEEAKRLVHPVQPYHACATHPTTGPARAVESGAGGGEGRERGSSHAQLQDRSPL